MLDLSFPCSQLGYQNTMQLSESQEDLNEVLNMLDEEIDELERMGPKYKLCLAFAKQKVLSTHNY